MLNSEAYGDAIRRARLQSSLTQKGVGDRLSVAQGTISNWETNQTEPNEQQKEELEKVLGTLYDSNEGPPAFGAWLTRSRIEKDLSVAELAGRSVVAAPTIYAIESGRIVNPRQKTVRKLEKALGSKLPADAAAETQEQARIEGLGELVGFDPHFDDDVPAVKGIYVLYDVSERPIYVGESNNIKHRLRDHRDKFWFRAPIVETGAYVEVNDRELRRKIETILIRFLKSNAVLNKQKVER